MKNNIIIIENIGEKKETVIAFNNNSIYDINNIVEKNKFKHSNSFKDFLKLIPSKKYTLIAK